MEKTKKNRIKKVILAALAVAAVACITSSMTLAYLTDKKTKTNMFTGSKDVTAILYETDWDGSTATSSKELDNATLSKGIGGDPDNPYGKKEAESYKLGDPISKNPRISNTSEYDEYIAMKVTYKVKLSSSGGYEEVTENQFNNLVALKYGLVDGINTTNWEKDSATGGDNTSTIYYYKTEVAKEKSTEALFTTVTVSEKVIPDQYYCLTEGKAMLIDDSATGGHKVIKLDSIYTMPEFEIDIIGAVVKADDYTGGLDSAKDILKNLLNS